MMSIARNDMKLPSTANLSKICGWAIVGGAVWAAGCSSGSSKAGVAFHAKGPLSSHRMLDIEVSNRTLGPVHVHERDYLFSVTCKAASGSETLFPSDPTVEWQTATPGNGTLVRPGETVLVSVAFRKAPASLIGCVPSQVEYAWP